MSREERFGGQVGVSHVASKGRWEIPVISLNGSSTDKVWRKELLSHPAIGAAS
ncbi:hypothetical protein [Sorangium sp. So ce861]|uniref:hypothetical protein n=1 Tax=Sorangium sp. So ce861 TaxID=3133323 RepID=UPI003F5D90A5